MGGLEEHPDAIARRALSGADRVFLDLARARHSVGKDFGRRDPRTQYYLRRAKVNALLEIARALREVSSQGGAWPP